MKSRYLEFYTLCFLPALALAVSGIVSPVVAEENVLGAKHQRAVEKLQEKALADDRAYGILESLTTEIGQRLAGSDAEARARDWGMKKFKSLGFKNARIEEFEIPYWSRTHEEASIVSPYPQDLYITALGNSVPTGPEGLTAEVVRFASLSALKAAPMTGLEGKIIFVDEPMTRTQDGSGYGPAVAKRAGAANEAGKRGAAAAIIRSVGTDSHRFPHTGVMRYANDVEKVPTAALSNPDADQLARAIAYADGPVEVFLKIGTETIDAVTSGNVIAEIPGETDELIVIGGHLDSWDLGTGAVDDGAGVAITVAAAKLIDEMRGKPRRTIRVIMWGAEEVGLLGARAYATAHADELAKHVFASESDFGGGRIWKFQSRFSEEDLPKAKLFADALLPLGISPGDNLAFGGPDVTPLRMAGVPVASLRQDGTDYFDLHHTPDDTFDKIDPEDLNQNVAAWATMIYLASELPGDFRESVSPVVSE
ncbi:MAG: M20/M25/M40 family metallo-hydrolase [Pseudomonadota bacterium]